jgi:hypothetical protein
MEGSWEHGGFPQSWAIAHDSMIILS